MKITYPECQIELDVDEAIELLDYMERTSPKLVWQPTDETLNDFLEGFKRVPDEESQPAPVPYPMEEESTPVEIPKERNPESTKKTTEEPERKSPYKTIRCPKCGHKFKEEVPDFMEGEFYTECPNCGTRISGVRDRFGISIFTFPAKEQPEPQPAPVPYPKEEEPSAVAPSPSERGCLEAAGESVESTISRKNEIPKIPKTRKPYTTSKKVQVLFETGWKTYKSVAEAAKALEVNYKTLYHNLTIGKPCKKHQVRYADDNNDKTETTNEEQPELP